MDAKKLKQILEEHKNWFLDKGGSRANLSRANLSRANLSRANLSRADLSEANLSLADLSEANLSGANLSGANLSKADLSEADLSLANLSKANLSEAKGLLCPTDYLKKTFKKTSKGIIVYKAFGAMYSTPENWKLRKNSIIKEVVNFDRTVECACGVNVGTLKWVKGFSDNEIWECLIEWEWLAGVCVPYHTGGKIRAEKVRLIKKI